MKDVISLRCNSRDLSNIQLLGWQSSDQVEALMKSSDVFVFPSYYEGFPNVIVEALATALPLITTAVGSIADSAVDGHNAIIVDVGDKKSLQSAMELMVKNVKLRALFSKNSLDIYYDRHSRELNCSKIVDALS